MAKFETNAGRVYRNVKFTKITDGGISFTHADGTARLRYEDLSTSQREFYGITKEDAEAVYKRETTIRIAYEQKVAEREKLRNFIAEKEAETRRLEAEVARAERALAELSRPVPMTEAIPQVPTILRVDSGRRPSRSRYVSYNTYEGYGGTYFGNYYGNSNYFRCRTPSYSYSHRPSFSFTFR